MSDKKFANLDRKSLDRLNDMQHEITDAEGKGVILVAFDRDCGGCKGGCGCHWILGEENPPAPKGAGGDFCPFA